MGRVKRSRNTHKKAQANRVGLAIGLGLFLASIALYSNTLGHGFVFDDVTLILQNPQVKDLEWSEIFGKSGYRPVRTLTYALNYWLGGESPYGYHLFNIVLHGINAVLLFLLLEALSGSRLVAGSAALLFAVHPVQTAAVAYISGRKDLLAAFFIFLGCLAYVRYRKTPRWPWAAGFLICFLLAVLSKEVAIVFPVLLLLLHGCLWARRRHEQSGDPPDWTLFEGSWAAIRRARFIFIILAVLSSAALYYAVYITQASRMEGYWGGSLATNFGTSFKLFFHYVRISILPYPLIADYSGEVFNISEGFLEPATLAAVLFFGLYSGAAVWWARDRPVLGFGMLWFLLCLLPVLHLIPFHELAADHFLYIPLMGMALLGGVAVRHLVEVRRMGILAIGLLLGVAILYSATAYSRNRVWKSEQTLWEETYRQAPGSYRANANLAVLFLSQGEHQRAIEFARRSTEISPNRAVGWSNLGGLYQGIAQSARQRGVWAEALKYEEEAIGCLQKAVSLDPYNAFTISNLADSFKGMAQVVAEMGDEVRAQEYRQEAARQFERAFAIGSDSEFFPLIWYKAGLLFVDMGDFERALVHFQTALAAFPELALGHYWAGFSAYRSNRFNEAIRHLKAAVGLDRHLESWRLLARCLEETGQVREAVETLRLALGHFPEAVDLHYRLGALSYRLGDRAQGERHLLRALELAPQGPLSAGIRKMLEDMERTQPL